MVISSQDSVLVRDHIIHVSTKGVHGDLASCPVPWRHRHSCACDTGPEFNADKTMCWCNIRFVLTTQNYISTTKINNSINQLRFEECWVRLGIQHEKQNLENKTCIHKCTYVVKETPLSGPLKWMSPGWDRPANGGLHCWFGQWNATASRCSQQDKWMKTKEIELCSCFFEVINGLLLYISTRIFKIIQDLFAENTG